MRININQATVATSRNSNQVPATATTSQSTKMQNTRKRKVIRKRPARHVLSISGIDEDDTFHNADNEALFPDIDPYFQNQIYPKIVGSSLVTVAKYRN